jgi:hypothetical protein
MNLLKTEIVVAKYHFLILRSLKEWMISVLEQMYEVIMEHPTISEDNEVSRTIEIC